MRWRYLVRGEQASSAEIVFVDLDASTVSMMGERPWNRRRFGETLHALLEYGDAKVVGLDVILSKFGTGTLLDLKRARAGDAFMGEVVAVYADRIVLAAGYTGTISALTDEIAEPPLIRDGYTDPEVVPFPEAPTFPIIDWQVGRLGLANADEDLSRGLVPYLVPAFVELEGARYSAHLMDGAQMHKHDFMNDPQIIAEGGSFKLSDKDGWVTYEVPDYSKQRLLTMSLEVFLAANGLGPEAVSRTRDELIITKDDATFRRIPLRQQQSVELNWMQSWSSPYAENYRMREVLEQREALLLAAEAGDAEEVQRIRQWFGRFKDKIIFLGPVDPQLKDVAPTPFETAPVPKVGMHANLLRTIQDEAYIYRVGPILAFATTAAVALLVSVLALWSGAGRALTRIASVLVIVCYVPVVFYCFAAHQLVVPLIAPVGAGMTAALCTMLLKLGSEEWQRRRIKSLFGAYVSPELVDEMVDAQRDPELGGTEAEITALFSDVEGFSTLSEKLHPDELVTLMNEYLSAMTDVLHVEGGTLDKYIGDAIVTMFGMPLPVPDHAARACLGALRMQERHAQLRAEWRASGKWPEDVGRMRTRIGMNTGFAVIGNMGSKVRFNYTMMGDTVNLAARCESGAKSYGVYTMLSAETLKEALRTLPDLFYRKLDRIVVKGRSEPVEIYELWDQTIDRDQAEACKALYEVALEIYFSGNWQVALDKFRESEALEPLQGVGPTTPSAVLAARCELFVRGGAPDDWDGVYRMQNK